MVQAPISATNQANRRRSGTYYGVCRDYAQVLRGSKMVQVCPAGRYYPLFGVLLV